MKIVAKVAAILAVVSVVAPSLAAGAASDPGERYFAAVAASFDRAGMPAPGHRVTAEDYRVLILGSFERAGVPVPVVEVSGEAHAALIRASFERQDMVTTPAPCQPGS